MEVTHQEVALSRRLSLLARPELRMLSLVDRTLLRVLSLEDSAELDPVRVSSRSSSTSGGTAAAEFPRAASHILTVSAQPASSRPPYKNHCTV